MENKDKIYYRHHYWEPPIFIYLFLGGLAGGILFLSWIMDSFVFPGIDLGQVLLCPIIVALVCVVIGLIFLVIDLGQPPVFYRAYVTATSIIKWGAVLLTIAAVFSLVWILGQWEWQHLRFLNVFHFFAAGAGAELGIAGVAGFGIMVYTGVMLSTLKAHSFWSTPALPILFTVSALSTGCAAIMLSLCFWPGICGPMDYIAGEGIHEILHLADIVLVFMEITILLIMILSFLGAGNRTQQQVARRWVKGEWKLIFWVGMIGFGLVIPLFLNISDISAMGVVASVLVLCGGLLLRALCVFSDDRQPLPGENKFYKRLQTHDTRFLSAWKYGENEF